MITSTPGIEASTPARGYLVASSSLSAQLHVFCYTRQPSAQALTVDPLLTLQLPEGYRIRGVTIDSRMCLLALGGRRQQHSVIFNSPKAQQQLLLCTFHELHRMAEAEEDSAANSVDDTVAGTAAIESTDLPAEEKSDATKDGLRADTIESMLERVCTHIDTRFERLEHTLMSMQARMGRLEVSLQNAGLQSVACAPDQA